MKVVEIGAIFIYFNFNFRFSMSKSCKVRFLRSPGSYTDSPLFELFAPAGGLIR